MNSTQCACFAARSICCCVAPGVPYAMFSAIVPSKSVGSCDTTPMNERSDSGSTSRTSCPSNDTTPAVGS